jgi:hypothetical protein
MLPTPATDDAKAAIARVRRIADSPRTRRLDVLERLWKGEQHDGRPSFWDNEVPLNERAPCVQSSIAESSGRRLCDLVFGNSRFPTASIDAKSYGVSFSDDERSALSKLWSEVVDKASLRVGMRMALEQGLMTGSVVPVCSISKGKPRLELLPAKYCEPTRDDCGELESIDYRYRYESGECDRNGNPIIVWYRRLIDRQSDSVWQGVPTDKEGYEPDWIIHKPTRVTAHGFGFVPALWHRNQPDVSDSDPIDGSALFAGLEDEIFALDMAMSQRHRNGRYNGEPQIVRVGFGQQASPMGDVGRTANPSGPAPSSWFSQFVDKVTGRWTPNGAATKKGPGRFWDVPQGGDAKMLESSGAGAQILTADIDGLTKTIREARSIVIASPETISANASAALLRQIFEPMLGVADNLREEYGPLLLEIVAMLIRIACVAKARGMGVLLASLDDAMPALGKCFVRVMGSDVPVWLGIPASLTWGEYFEPTWQDVQNAIGSARLGNGDQPVLTIEESVRLVAPLLGIRDVDAYVAKLTGQHAAAGEAAHALLNSALGNDAPAPVADVAVADTAMNGAQVASLQSIIESAVAGTMPVETARAMIAAAFPSLTHEQINAIVSPLPQHAGVAQAHAELQAEHASLKASHNAKSRMLDNVLAENAAGRVVKGSPVGIGAKSEPGDVPAAESESAA